MKVAKSPEKEGVPGMHSSPGKTTNEWLALSKRKPSGSIRAADAGANGDQPSNGGNRTAQGKPSSPKRQPRQSRSKKAATLSAQTSEWLAVPKATPSGSSRTAPRTEDGKKEPKRTSSQRSPKAQHRGRGVRAAVSQWRRISASLRRVKQDQQAQWAELSRLETELTEARAENASMAKRLEQKFGDATEQLERAEAVAEAQSEPTPTRKKTKRTRREPVKLPKGKLDVNALSVEECRALGLSVTQSARLIALRDVNDGFSEIDELDRVVGFPEELRRTLKRRLVVRG
jgi:DNA uptake protein ComE-like DNA-binding protein